MRYPVNRRHLKTYPISKRRCFYGRLNSKVSAQSCTWARKAFQAEELKSTDPSSSEPNCETTLTLEETMKYFKQENGNLCYYQRLRAGTETNSSSELLEPMRPDNPKRGACQTKPALKLWELFPQLLPKLSNTQCQLSAYEKVKSCSEMRELGTAISENYLNDVNELFELGKIYDLMRAEQKELAKEIERRSNDLTEVIFRHKKTLEQIAMLENLMGTLRANTFKPIKPSTEQSAQKEEQRSEAKIDRTTPVSTTNDGVEEKRITGGFNRTSEAFLQFTTTYAAVRKYAYLWMINAGVRKRSIMDLKMPTHINSQSAKTAKLLNKMRSTTSLILEDTKPFKQPSSLISDALSNKTYDIGSVKSKSEEDQTKNSKKESGKKAKEHDKGTKKSKKQKKRKSTQQSEATEGNAKKKQKGRKGSKPKKTEKVTTDQDTNGGVKSYENFSKISLKTGQEGMLAAKPSMRSIRSTISRGSRKKRNTGPFGKLKGKDNTKSDISLLEEYWGVSLRQSIAPDQDHVTNLLNINSLLNNLIVEEKQKPHYQRTKSMISKKSVKQKQKPEEISDLLKLFVLLQECEACEKKQKDAKYQALKRAEEQHKTHCDLMRKAAGLPDCLPDEFNSTNAYYC